MLGAGSKDGERERSAAAQGVEGLLSRHCLPSFGSSASLEARRQAAAARLLQNARVTMVAAPVLSVRGLRKSYGDAVVLRDLDLDIAPGQVHALLGENGAGKSTLIKTVAGVVVPDRGSVRVAGRELVFGSPQASMALGVSTLFQELATVGGLSVAENVFLGHPTPSRLGVVRWGSLNEAARRLFARLGQDLDVRRDVARLTPVQRTMTALARALALDSPLLILDEPTSALTDAETRELFAVIGRLTGEGVAVLYVSHRLDEVFRIADAYTVLRNGEAVARGTMADATPATVISAMAGRPMDVVFPAWQPDVGSIVLEARGLTGRRIRDASLAVRQGEVVGVAGLAGSGRSELLRLIAGAARTSEGGLLLDGTPFRPRGIADAQRAGVVLVPQERRADALLPDSVERNLNASTIGVHAHVGGIVSPRRERAHARQLWRELDVRGRSLEQDVLTLSGGNQQKVVLARFLALQPRVLLLDEPTRGVDVATKSQIYTLVRQRAAAGCAVLIVSSELPELLGLSDRIVVIHDGRVQGMFEHGAATEEALLHACYGRAA
jgi:ABC-type sugar transport system ATPase subunit